MVRVLNLFLWELRSVEINGDLAGDEGAEAVLIGLTLPLNVVWLTLALYFIPYLLYRY